MAMKKIVYCGSIPKVADEFIVSVEFDVMAIICQVGTTSNEMVYLSCLREVPIIEVSSKRHLEEVISAIDNIDSIVICGFGIILSKKLIKSTRAYNFHPGELPNYKGRHPTFFATVSGEKMIGVTLHEVTSVIDEGRIVGIEMLPYGYRETEIDLFNKIHLGVRALIPKLVQALEGEMLGELKTGGIYFKPVTEFDKTFDANDSPSRIINIVRAQARYEGGIFVNDGCRYWVKKLSVRDINTEWTMSQGVLFNTGQPVGIKISDSKVLFFESIKPLDD